MVNGAQSVTMTSRKPAHKQLVIHSDSLEDHILIVRPLLVIDTTLIPRLGSQFGWIMFAVKAVLVIFLTVNLKDGEIFEVVNIGKMLYFIVPKICSIN